MKKKITYLIVYDVKEFAYFITNKHGLVFGLILVFRVHSPRNMHGRILLRTIFILSVAYLFFSIYISVNDHLAM